MTHGEALLHIRAKHSALIHANNHECINKHFLKRVYWCPTCKGGFFQPNHAANCRAGPIHADQENNILHPDNIDTQGASDAAILPVVTRMMEIVAAVATSPEIIQNLMRPAPVLPFIPGGSQSVAQFHRMLQEVALQAAAAAAADKSSATALHWWTLLLLLPKIFATHQHVGKASANKELYNTNMRDPEAATTRALHRILTTPPAIPQSHTPTIHNDSQQHSVNQPSIATALDEETRNTEQQRVKHKVVRLIAAGDLAKAASTISQKSTVILPSSHEVVQRVQEKFPPGPVWTKSRRPNKDGCRLTWTGGLIGHIGPLVGVHHPL